MSIKDLRKNLKTSCNKEGYPKQEFLKGAEGIEVKYLDGPVNPYKAMFEMVTSTWGHDITKWENTKSTDRFFIVLQALMGNCLPLSLESPKFTFAVKGCSRSAFDQIARQRIGTAFGAMGIRDNSHYNFPFRIPNFIYRDDDLKKKFKKIVGQINELYKSVTDNHKGSWQAARSILPMGMCYKFDMTINYAALKGFCSRRLAFCEQEDTVAVAWLLKFSIEVQFPLLSDFLVPACDNREKCLYADNYKMSHLFGELFRPCGRHEANTDYEGEFNYACSDRQEIEKDLLLKVPSGNECVFRLNDFRKLNSKITSMAQNGDQNIIDTAIEDFMTNSVSETDWRLFNAD